MTMKNNSRRKGTSRMLVVGGATLALALAGCGGSDADGGGDKPEEAFGVEIDERTPEGVAVSYVKLIDTCKAAAARRAFKLLVDPDSVEQSLSDEDRERFEGQGLCDDPNQAPVATIRTGMLDTHPVDNTPLPADTVLVTLDADPETANCEGTADSGLAVTDVQGTPRVDTDLTVELGDNDLLDDGCVEG